VVDPDGPSKKSVLPLILIVALAVAAMVALLTRQSRREVDEPVSAVVAEPAEKQDPESQLRQVLDKIKRNRNITDTLRDHGLPYQEIRQLVESARPVYNLAKVVAGRAYWLNYESDGSFRHFGYHVDRDRYLTVYRNGDQYVPVMKEFEFETRVEPVSGRMESSLYAAIVDAGENDGLADLMADIFMWTIDFYTDIQRGDSFRLLVEKLYLDGEFTRYGNILAADITVQGKTFTGFRFETEPGVTGYYHHDGSSLKRTFLKSPLKFTRISSRFSYARRHPILKIVRPHLGVDYAAPRGTPVVAVASGKVRRAGRNGGYGNMVRLRHIRGYETLYGHLSRIAVKAGTQVSQGQIIGYVGSTGLSSGPHLDFRVIHHGKYINPLKAVFPPRPPVPEESMGRFAEVRDRLQTQLDRINFFGELTSR
jgi:murein DD-endopeptidase MepM/ murein hydrolase activator NlpD